MVITASRPRGCSSSNLFRACFSTTAKSKLAPRDRAISSPRRKSCVAQKRKIHFRQKPLTIGFRRRYPSAKFRCRSWPGKLCRRILESLKTRKSVEELMVNLTPLRADTPGADNGIHFNNASARFPTVTYCNENNWTPIRVISLKGLIILMQGWTEQCSLRAHTANIQKA